MAVAETAKRTPQGGLASRLSEFAQRDINWWRWAVVLLLFLHVPVDFATTLLAIREYGVRPEANPLLRVLLAQSVWAASAFVLAVAIVSVLCFAGLFDARRNADGTTQQVFTIVLKAWMGMLILVGLIIVVNNMVMISAGMGLIG